MQVNDILRGAVLGLETGKRKHEYQIAERLDNIYYLMWRHGGASNRVLAVVKFMPSFYAPGELVEKTRRIAEEACGLPPNERQDHFCAYRDIYRLLPSTPEFTGSHFSTGRRNAVEPTGLYA